MTSASATTASTSPVSATTPPNADTGSPARAACHASRSDGRSAAPHGFVCLTITQAGPRSAAPDRCGRGGVEDVVVRQRLALERRRVGRERAVVGVAPSAPVAGSRLMRVLAVAERLDLLERDRQAGRIRVGGTRQAGLVREVDAGDRHPLGQHLGDPRIVGSGMPERVDRQRRAQPDTDPAVRLELRQHCVVLIGRGHDGDRGMVLGGRADHRRAADVDLLDQVVETDPRPSRRDRERIEIDNDQLERRDRRGQELAPVVGRAAVGQDPAVDARVQRLDPAVEHLRAGRHRRDVCDRQAGIAQRTGRAPGRDELEPGAHESGCEWSEAGLVRDRQERAARDRNVVVGQLEVDPDTPTAGLDRERASQQESDGPRQQAVLDAADPIVEGADVVVGQDRDRVLGHDRPAVERLVDEVDRAPRHGHAVARERRRPRARPGRQGGGTGAC